MLLRIRWQRKCSPLSLKIDVNCDPVIEANYSTALMLLLKYPAPTQPPGPQTFVDDAIYLRSNFSAAGGAKIISQYGAEPPLLPSPDSRPHTPLALPMSPRPRFSRQKSPLPSPVRFLQQQGGVEGLFRGAAKGVLERGERLGINQAVRDAVGEVRQNMQGLQVSRSNSTRQEGARWSLDEGKSVPSSKASISAMNTRNKQLARMLEQAMAELRTASISKEVDKDKCVEAMDIAIAKVDFVKIYLEDATMPLPPDSPLLQPSSPALETEKPQLQLPTQPLITPAPNTAKSAKPSTSTSDREISSNSPIPHIDTDFPLSTEGGAIGKSKENTKSEDSIKSREKAATQAGLVAARPKAMPTRSTIAQS
jgi:TBC1 domain family protein 5